MTDERITPPADVIASGFAGLIEGLRDDVREDLRDIRTEIGRSEERMTAQIAVVRAEGQDTRSYIEQFAKGHAVLHEEESTERRKTHSEFYDFIRKAELDEARRNGALGVVRWTVELLSKHSVQIVTLLGAAAALVGFVTGNVRLELGR